MHYYTYLLYLQCYSCYTYFPLLHLQVQGNLNYILHSASREETFHNGTRDLGRQFGQFCLRKGDEADRAAMAAQARVVLFL